MPRTYTGIVQKGARRGTALGYPTANIRLHGHESGIFAARVTLGKDPYIAAVFADTERNFLEAHILDFAGDLYGKKISITLHKKLRDVQKFDDDAALRMAIAGDVAATRSYFASA